MRPSLFVNFFKFVVATLGKQTTNGYVHQVLLLFLGKFFTYLAKLLYTDQEQDGFEVRFFSKSAHQFRFKVPPTLLEVIVYKHSDKDKRSGFETIDYRLYFAASIIHNQ